MITENQITRAREDFEEYHEEFINSNCFSTYVNREKDADGNTVSAYIGIEDAGGRAITGYDYQV